MMDLVWNSRYQELVRFYKKHGHLGVKNRDNISLNRWIWTQRRRYNGEKGFTPLSEQQIELMDDIGFAWDPVDSRWNLKYKELAEFHQKHGHLKVEQRGSLYRWMATQRLKRNGMAGYAPLTDKQIQLLDDLNFVWRAWDEGGWIIKYRELAEFHRKHGHLNVEKKKNESLYHWMRNQRLKRKGAKGRVPLTDEQIQLLDDIDFVWDNPGNKGCPKNDKGRITKDQNPERGGFNEKRWNLNYQDLVNFYKKHGHFNVERNDSSGLYRWMIRQRSRRRGAKGYTPLADEQIQLLDKIGFPWNQADSIWNSNYQELAKFYKTHGHLRGVECNNGSLDHWMGTQRKRRKGKKEKNAYVPLTDVQIQLLDDINFDWNPPPEMGRLGGLGEATQSQAAWITKYQELAEFHKKHGHLRVERSNGILFRWIRTQRERYKGTSKWRTPLTVKEIRLLEDIGFSWDPIDSRWNSQYQECVKFYKKHGHFRAEFDGSLYRWIKNQRQKRKGTKGYSPLTDEQIQLLDDIDFVWNPREKNED